MNQNQKTPLRTTEEGRQSLRWFVLDAKGKILGRFASEVAKILRGKHKTDFTPHIDHGDGVIIINCEKIEVTGNKEANKVYRRYTGYMGGLREEDFRNLMKRKPEAILDHAVRGMMPKTRLAEKQLRRLRIFVGENYSSLQAQQPIIVKNL